MRNIFTALLFFISISLFSQEEKRLALVIGNANYDKEELKNPVNDARLIASTLDSLDFDVILKENLENRTDFIRSIREFGSKRSEYDVAFVYYAGHGIQVDDENFLLPTKEEFSSEEDVLDFGVSVQNVMRYLRAQTNEVNILILDACRDNPFESNWNTTRSLKGGGLAKIPPPTGSLIAFSTDSGQTAPDGEGENSIYTISLAKNMLLEDTSIDQVFRNVRAEVLAETNGEQRPVEATQLTGQTFYLKSNFFRNEVLVVNDLIKEKKFELALEKVNNLTIKFPKNEKYIALKLKILNTLERTSEALSIIKKINIESVEFEQLTLEIANSYIGIEDYENAILNLEKLISQEYKMTLILSKLSYCYREMKDYPNSDSIIYQNLEKSKTIAERNRKSDDYFNLSYHYVLMENLQESINYLEKGIELDFSKESFLKFCETSYIISTNLGYNLISENNSRKYFYQVNDKYFNKMTKENYSNEFEFLAYYSDYLLNKSFSIDDDTEILNEAIQIMTDALEIKKDPYIFNNRAIAQNNLSYDYYGDEENEDFKTLINKAISDFTFAYDYSGEDSFAYFDSRWIFYLKAKLFNRIDDQEMRYASLKECEKLLDDEALTNERLLYDLTIASYETDRDEEAIKYADKTEEVLRELCDGIGNVQDNCDRLKRIPYIKGRILKDTGNYDDALKSHLKSIELTQNDFLRGESFDVNYDVLDGFFSDAKFSPQRIEAIELAIFLDKIELAEKLLSKKEINDDINKEINGVFNSIVHFKKTGKIKDNFNYDKEIFNTNITYYDIRVITNYIHLLFISGNYEKLIEICKDAPVDWGFLYVLTNSYLKKGNILNATMSLSKLFEYIDYSQLDLDFINYVSIDDGNKLLKRIEDKINNLSLVRVED